MFVAHASVSVPAVAVDDTLTADHGLVRVSSARVSAMAPSALISPAPWVRGSAPASGVAVYWRIALTAYGLSGAMCVPSGSRAVRFASSTSATTPLTTAADILDPLRRT